ncbi:MAG: hypothetical protein H7255_04220 [Ramlibacter sp.]|nr:hypothetical protein [Ramlibacter sp.]
MNATVTRPRANPAMQLMSLAVAAALAVTSIPALAQNDSPDEVSAHDSPAQVEGLWCGSGLLSGASLELSQHRKKFDGTLRYRNRERLVRGDIEGSFLRTFSEKAGELVLVLQGTRLRIHEAGGNLALARGQSFVRATSGGCA